MIGLFRFLGETFFFVSFKGQLFSFQWNTIDNLVNYISWVCTDLNASKFVLLCTTDN